MTTLTNSQARFAVTRWSVVMQTAVSRGADAGSLLAQLAQRYSFPVYTYLRRCGHSAENARHRTHEFLEHLAGIVRNGRSLPPKSHFRSFLLAELNAFLAGDASDDAGQAVPDDLPSPSANLEQRYERDKVDADSPEQAYQRSFALEVIARAFDRLRAEAQRTGHLDMYTALEPYLASEPPAGRYEELAATLRSRPLALIVALKRLRQRFRELVSDELADTVTSAEGLADEHRTLHSALRLS